jgi:hypothetical protein
MNKIILGKITAFGNFYKFEDTNVSSFSNWNARDVIGHINTWVDYLNRKLDSFKNNNLFEDIEKNVNEIEKYNKENYEKNKNKNIDNIINDSKTIFKNYKNSLNLFTEDELDSAIFPTGFGVKLWRYASKDLVTHSINHILYQYLKRKDYNEFIKECEDVYKYCNDYSDEIDAIYYFQDLFENEGEKKSALSELSEKYNKNKIIMEIIKINIE